MTSLHDDEIETHEAGHRIDPQADTDGDDTDTTDGDATTPTPGTRMPATPTRTTRTPRKAAAAALARCLEPVDAETFLAEHWERLPLVVPRDEPGRFDDLLSEADVERLVCSTAIRYPAFRLVREGSQIDVGSYTRDVSWRPPFTRTADVTRVLAEWEAGATIVLQALHVNWQPLAVFCRLLEGALGRPRAGQLLLHAARLAGLRGPSRHPRRARAAGRGREALAALRPAARAPAQAPALLDVARRARRGDGRARAPGRRHPVPAARLAARGGDVRHRLAPSDDRDHRAHLGRRRAGRARRARGRAGVQA